MIRTKDLVKYLQVDVWLMASSHKEKEYLAEIMRRLKVSEPQKRISLMQFSTKQRKELIKKAVSNRGK